MGLFAVGFKWTVIGGINFFLCWASIGLISFGGYLSNKLPGSLELGGTMGLKAPIYLIIIGVFTLLLTFPGNLQPILHIGFIVINSYIYRQFFV